MHVPHSILRCLLACLTSAATSACGGAGATPPPQPAGPAPALIGSGTFRPASPATVRAGSQPAALTVGDWNADGHLDLAVGNHLGGTISLLLGTGQGTFVAGATIPLGPGHGVFELRSGRLDAGATLDLVAADPNNGTARVYLGVGDGTFTPGATLTVPGADDVMGVALGDVNGDAILDVLATARNPGIVGVFLGLGNGTFTMPFTPTFAVGYEARQCTLADFDADGNLDAAVSIRNGEAIEIHLGHGDGTFTEAAASPVAAGDHAWMVVAADLDGNGTLDLAAPGDTSNAVALFSGDGLGGFAVVPGSPLPVGAAPYGIAQADLNGDARADLVVANLAGDSLSVLLGSAAGLVPAPTPTIPVGTSPFALQLADLNEDGVLDIAVANEGDGSVSILLGNPR